MSIANYTELKTAIKELLQRGIAFETLIPTWISLAEASIGRDLRVWRMESIVSLDVVSGNEIVSLPTRLRDMRWVKLTGSNERLLTHIPPAAMQDMYAQAEAGTPKFFTISGESMILRPIPSENATLSAACILAPIALGDTNATNDILTYYPDVYLYGALIHAFIFLRNRERLADVSEAYRVSVENANKESRNRNMMAAPYGTVRVGGGKIV